MSRFVVIHTITGELQANLIKSLLEANGIPTMLSQESAAQTLGFTVGAMSMVEILIPEERVAEAEAILEDSNLGSVPVTSEGHFHNDSGGTRKLSNSSIVQT